MIMLAPMAGVTDLAFRLICKDLGCDFVVSEMVSAQGLIYSNSRTQQLLVCDDFQRPFAIQLFGHDPSTLAEGARRLVRNYRPDLIDINMGCPTPKVVKNGDGAALLKHPDRIYQLALAVVRSVDIPVTAKIRIGWDQDSINCVEVAKRLEDAGIQWVAVHGRTREQFYTGEANWGWIRRVKDAIGIPVVGNGDVFTPEGAKKLLSETGCDHVMIGRGALGNPWVFRRTQVYLDTGELLPEPGVDDRVAMAMKHLDLKITYLGEERALREMRSHLAWYLKGVPNSSQIRARINHVSSRAEVGALLSML